MVKANRHIHQEPSKFLASISDYKNLRHCFRTASICLSLILFTFCAGDLQAHEISANRSHRLYADSLPMGIPLGLLQMPKLYHAPRALKPVIIDGNLSEQAWEKAPWSDRFLDIAGNSVLEHKRIDSTDRILPTRVKMCWDDAYLYIAAELTEPDLWATLKKRDTIIYQDNDFEVFFSPSASTFNYYELEINQLGTVLDLLMTRPYRNGGQALIHWDLKGLKTAVKLHGTLNNVADKDSGWIVEMAIPFKGVLGFARPAPRIGSYWRINFSRVQWDVHPTATGGYQRNTRKGKLLPEHNWVWSPQGIVNMHAPDRWGYLFFVKDSTRKTALPLIELQKAALWKIYYAQQYTYAARQKFALTLSELNNVDSSIVLKDPANGKTERFILQMNADKEWFRVCLMDPRGRELMALDQSGFLSVLN